MLDDYRKARKLGQRQVQRDVSDGRYPYPPALDDILKNEGYQGEVPIGLIEVDMSLIAGTRTRGRQNSFSSGFLPLPEPSSEFASKWSDLIDSQRAEGIRDPIIVYEFGQRFYVQEGNKRVSVMRYLGQPTILANVTRVIPMASDDKNYRMYQEFAQFYNVAPIYGLTFSEEGGYAKLAALVGEALDKPWAEDRVKSLRAVFDAFSAEFRRRRGELLGMTPGDAFLIYLKAYPFESVVNDGADATAEKIDRVWSEFVVARDGGQVAYLENPAENRLAIIPELKTLYKQAVLAKPFKISFIYEHNPLADGWTQLHERGRIKLEQRLGASVATRAFPDCEPDDDFNLAVDEAVAWESDLIVTIAPTQMRQALRAAVAHPEVPFINCSLSLSHSAVRTFGGRMYEAKFLLGALAASMADNHCIGYVAETPVYGTVSEINAFAIGAAMIDPYATVCLKWYTAKDYDWQRELAEADVHVVLARDYANPADSDEAWGLYRVEEDGTTTHLAEPIWKWGRYYELLVRSIRNETWHKEGSVRPHEALNYWWGMSAGVLDVRLNEEVLPYGQRVLVEGIRQTLLSGRINPFVGELRTRDGTVIQNEQAGRLSSEDIVRMSWLNANIDGRLPLQVELSESGLEQVEVSGLIPLDPATLPHKGTAS